MEKEVKQIYDRERICPQCGKKFICYIETWVYCRTPYGNARKFFCSWTCLNNYDKARAKTRKRRGRKPKSITEATDDKQTAQSV